MNTPGNTNEQILRLALDDLEGVNPNYEETIEGTLENPWGSVDVAKLHDAIVNQNATIILSANVSIIMGYDYTLIGYVDDYYLDDTLNMNGANVGLDGNTMAYECIWTTSGGYLVDAKAYMVGTVVNLMDKASEISTNIKIVWHPLPEV